MPLDEHQSDVMGTPQDGAPTEPAAASAPAPQTVLPSPQTQVSSDENDNLPGADARRLWGGAANAIISGLNAVWSAANKLASRLPDPRDVTLGSVVQHSKSLRHDVAAGLSAAAILIPQAMGAALVAGLPVATGLYAGVVALLIYAALGSARTLMMGPVALVAYMTAQAVSPFAEAGTAAYAGLAVTLALMTGVIVTAAGLLHFGIFSHFVARPVAAGIMFALAAIVMVAQIEHFLGISFPATFSIPEMLSQSSAQIGAANAVTLLIGLMALAVLLLRPQAEDRLIWAGLPETTARLVSHALPLILVVVSATLVWRFGLDVNFGVKTIAGIAAGQSTAGWPVFEWESARSLLPAALLISLVVMFETERVTRPLAAAHRQRLFSGRENIALGAANLGAGFAAGFPIAASAQRSCLNDQAAPKSFWAPLATVLIVLAALAIFAKAMVHLPVAVLAAVVVVMVSRYLDLGPLLSAMRLNRYELPLFAGAAASVLVLGVEIGIATAVAISLGFYLWQTSRPHVLEFDPAERPFAQPVTMGPGFEGGQTVPEPAPNLGFIKIEDNLNFANAAELERALLERVALAPQISQLVLSLASVKHIDPSALPVLESLFKNLSLSGVTVHLAGLDPRLRDHLIATGFLAVLSPGRIFPDPAAAITTLNGETAAGSLQLHDQAGQDWERIQTAADPAVFRQFAEKYPTSPFARTAVQKVDVLTDLALWQTAESAGTIEAYETYLRKAAPHKRYSGRAKSRLRHMRPQDPTPYIAAAVVTFVGLVGLWKAGEALLASPPDVVAQAAKDKTDARMFGLREASETRLVQENAAEGSVVPPVTETVSKSPELTEEAKKAAEAKAAEQAKKEAEEEQRTRIAKVQFLLKELGYRAGDVDGKLGTQTKRSIALFLEKMKKQNDGDKVSAALLEALSATKMEQERRWNKWSKKLPKTQEKVSLPVKKHAP